MASLIGIYNYMQRTFSVTVSDEQPEIHRFLYMNRLMPLESIPSEIFLRVVRDTRIILPEDRTIATVLRLANQIMVSAESTLTPLESKFVGELIHLPQSFSEQDKRDLFDLFLVHRSKIAWCRETSFLLFIYRDMKNTDKEPFTYTIIQQLKRQEPRTRLSQIIKLHKLGVMEDIFSSIEEMETLFTEQELSDNIFNDNYFLTTLKIPFETGKLSRWVWSMKLSEA